MKPTRSLSLRREVLAELAPAELEQVAGGRPTDMTCLSCLDYISCWVLDCLVSETCV